uniref:ATP synthase F0 subunit 8 n=1 Tax=Austrodecus sp. JZ-2022 TaxID=2992011 RepID=A0A9E7V4Q0_9CHEL|nr:ATP synthase F0 subunit 8 [Austrodecus sp. JZ-2022]
MPQMMPMNWFLPSSLMFMTMVIMFINLNFLLNIKTPNINTKMLIKINKNWLW